MDAVPTGRGEDVERSGTVRHQRLGVGVVRGRSMEPTLVDGDRVLLLHGSPPHVGRLAVVRLPDGVVAVKRVTARVPEGWWVERDNPREGVDSWRVGAVPDDRVVGRVLLRLPLRWWRWRRSAPRFRRTSL